MSIDSIRQSGLPASYGSSAGLSAVNGGNGLFSDMLVQELASDAAKSAATANNGDTSAAQAQKMSAADTNSSMLQMILPLMLTGGFSNDSTGSMTMALLLALSGSKAFSGDGDTSALSMLMGANGASFQNPLLSGGLLSGITSASGGMFGASGDTSAAGMAGYMAATSLSKAFSKAGTNTSALFNGNNISSIRSAGKSVNTSRGRTYGGTTLSSGAVVPVSASTPTTPAVTSSLQNRSASRYREVIEQFQVASAGRYQVNKRGNNDTYCNIFLWDVTSAMNAEIPHYTDWDTGVPLSYESVDTAKHMNANRISDWLNKQGPKYGWYEVTPEQAQALANEGRPAVTVWKNPTGGHGHVQVVSPSADGQYNAARGVAIAQAGRNLTDYTYITNVYGSRLKDVQYFAHA